MKVNLKVIAEKSGFSISTVSRVVNGSDKISSGTVDKVLKIANELGYKPKKKSAKTVKTKNIALVATGFHKGEFYSSYFHGLNKAALQKNVRLYLASVLDYKKEIRQLLKNLSTGEFDGVIFLVHELSRPDYEKIASELPAGFPIISNCLIENPVFPTITFDSYSGGYLAAQHFREQNYKRAGIISGPSERSESRFRKNGFIDNLVQFNTIDYVWNCEGDFTFQSGEKAFYDFLKLENKPDAVFASNDEMAYGFLQTAKVHGYNIPGDVALISYDDVPKNQFTQPQISSVKTDYDKLGSVTIKAILEQIQKTDLDSNLMSLVPVTISKKETT
jgi:DNA-binding LacI/PurR family transcriptional regulator